MTKLEQIGGLRVRTHGTSGPMVIVVHGGPAAVGHARLLAQGLSGAFLVLEPWQRGSGDAPLSVARHVADIHDLINARCAGQKPAIVGESWGAMLTLAYAAAHPESAGPLALIGCGTFDRESRARLCVIRNRRIDEFLGEHPEYSTDEELDTKQRIMKWHDMTDNFDTIPADPGEDPELGNEPFDIQAHTETWRDMLRCQDEGIYPKAFPAITSPVVMLHGTYDPHPGRMIRDCLIRHIPHLEYREWEKCGHSPWLEKHVRRDFFDFLHAWLDKHLRKDI